MAEELYVLPSSLGQQRLWLLEQARPGTSRYAMASMVRLRGPLDVAALRAAFGTIIDRHEVLRTVLRLQGHGVVQVVSEPVPGEIDVVDVEGGLAAATQRAVELAATPFDLGTGPLLRCTLLRLDADDHVLVIVVHHTIADGVSAGIFIRELTTIYAGGAAALPELPLQYADFAAWQREQVTSGVLDDKIAYWTSTLAGTPPLRLPADAAGPVPFSAVSAPVTIAAPVARQLRMIVPGVTPFMVLLAGYAALLARWSGQRDFAVGVPVAGRGEVELEPLIGLFINTVAIRVDVDPTASFGDLLGQVRQRCLAAYAHADVPFDLLVERLAPDRRAGRLPIAQVLLNVAPAAPTEFPAGPDLAASVLDLPYHTTHYDVTVDVVESSDALTGTLVLRSDRFTAATATLAANSLAALLRAAAATPGAPVGSLACPVEARRELAPPVDTDDDEPVGGAPDSVYEHLLRKLWAEVLENEQIGVEDEFYASGGNSLRAVRVVMGAREQGVELPLELMLGEHTIAQLAAAATAQPESVTGTAPTPVEQSASRAASTSTATGT